MMTLRHMKIFAEVCKEGSITRAAEHMRMTQPTVSIAIKELEQHYKVKLFERLNRQIYITVKGQELLQYAQTIISQFENAEDQLPSDNVEHIFHIGSNVSFGTTYLPAMLKQSETVLKGVSTYVCIDNTNKIEKKLANNELDFAIVDNLNISPCFISNMILHEYMMPFCGLHYSTSQNSIHDLLSLSKEPLLLREVGSGSRDIIEHTFSFAGITCIPLIESTSTLALINAACNNLGIVFLPESVKENSYIKQILTPLTIDENPFLRRYFLIYHKKKYISPTLKKYIEFILNFKWNTIKNI